MGIHHRRRRKFGPFYLNSGDHGLNSVSLKLGPASFKVWDKKGRKKGLTSVDLPGGYSYRPDTKPDEAAQRPESSEAPGHSAGSES